MGRMTRFGISLEEGLLKKLDERVAEAGFRNRSAALRDIVRNFLLNKKISSCQGEIFVILTLVVRSEAEVLAKLTKTLQQYQKYIRGVQQFAPEGDYFLNVIIFHGDGKTLAKVTDRFSSLKGVLFSGVQTAQTKPPCHS